MRWIRSAVAVVTHRLAERVCNLSRSILPPFNCNCIWKAAGIADALNRRRHDDEGAPLVIPFRSSSLNSVRSAPTFFPFVSRLLHSFEDHVVDAGVGKGCAVVENRDAGDGDDVSLLPASCQHGFRGLLQGFDRSSERSTVRHLHGDHQLALVLVGEIRRSAGAPMPRIARAETMSPTTTIRPLRRTRAAIRLISHFGPLIDVVEATIKEVALFHRHGSRSQSAHCVGLSVTALIALIEPWWRSPWRIEPHLAGKPGQEGGGKKYRHQHQSDAEDGAVSSRHRLDRGVVARHAPLDIARHRFRR